MKETQPLTDRRRILVLVHPGSLVGSANYNVGRDQARATREDIARELDAWSGDVLVINGALCDELASAPLLQQSIQRCLERNALAGHHCAQVLGEDPDQVERIRQYMVQRGAALLGAQFHLTGAWYGPNQYGCVGSVEAELRAAGHAVEVSDTALVDPDSQDVCDSEIGDLEAESDMRKMLFRDNINTA